jgi:hypothetical protein
MKLAGFPPISLFFPALQGILDWRPARDSQIAFVRPALCVIDEAHEQGRWTKRAVPSVVK